MLRSLERLAEQQRLIAEQIDLEHRQARAQIARLGQELNNNLSRIRRESEDRIATLCAQQVELKKKRETITHLFGSLSSDVESGQSVRADGREPIPALTAHSNDQESNLKNLVTPSLRAAQIIDDEPTEPPEE